VLKHADSTTCLWNHFNFKHKLSNGVKSIIMTVKKIYCSIRNEVAIADTEETSIMDGIYSTWW